MKLAYVPILICLFSACNSADATPINLSQTSVGATGPTGPVGAPGATGATGPTGPAGGTLTSNVQCLADVSTGPSYGNEQVVLEFQVTKFQSGAGFITCSVSDGNGTYSKSQMVSALGSSASCVVTEELQGDAGAANFWTFSANLTTQTYSARYSPGTVNYTFSSGQCTNI